MKAIQDKVQENIRLEKLQNYYEGKQEIIHRYYEDSTKPNNKIIINYMKEVADFYTSYLVGVPVEYTNAPQELTDNLKYNDNDESTIQAVKNMNVCGFSCELFYTDEAGTPRFAPLDPKECIIFMNDDLQQDIKGFIRLIKQDEEIGGYIATYYTSSDYTTYRVDEVTNSLTMIEEPTKHYFLDVPINLYLNNTEMQGSFEQAIPMQDALNKIMSDNVNDFESFVDSYLVLEGLQGTTTEDIANMKRDRVLLTDKDSKAYWLTKNVNNAHIKQLQDDIKGFIKSTCFLPDFDQLGTAIFSQSAEALKVKLLMTDTKAKGQERAITKALMRKLELLYNIMNISTKIGDYTAIELVLKRVLLSDVKIYQISENEADEYI